MRKGMKVALLAGLLGLATFVAAAQAMHFTAWTTAQKIDEIAGNSSELNTPSQDGCPIQSPDGLSLYMASNRPGGQGMLDIWVSRRESTNAPWGAPQNLGEPVNSAADDFCPTPVRGGGLFFVSREALPGSCGMGDIYFARLDPSAGLERAKASRVRAGRPEQRARRTGPSYFEVGGEVVSLLLAQLRDRPRRHLRQQEAGGRELRPGHARSRAERCGSERHPAERAQGRSRGRLLVQPLGHSRRPGCLGRDAGARRRSLVVAGQPRRGSEHGAQPRRVRRSRGMRGRSSSGAHQARRASETSTSARAQRSEWAAEQRNSGSSSSGADYERAPHQRGSLRVRPA